MPTGGRTGVLFSHLKPPDVRLYRRACQAPCQFNAERTTLEFPASVLDHRLAGADPQKLRILEAQAHARGELRPDFSSPPHLANLALAQGVSGDQVAKLLSMHRRTLNRRLQTEGTTMRSSRHGESRDCRPSRNTLSSPSRQIVRYQSAAPSVLTATIPIFFTPVCPPT